MRVYIIGAHIEYCARYCCVFSVLIRTHKIYLLSVCVRAVRSAHHAVVQLWTRTLLPLIRMYEAWLRLFLAAPHSQIRLCRRHRRRMRTMETKYFPFVIELLLPLLLLLLCHDNNVPTDRTFQWCRQIDVMRIEWRNLLIYFIILCLPFAPAKAEILPTPHSPSVLVDGRTKLYWQEEKKDSPEINQKSQENS